MPAHPATETPAAGPVPVIVHLSGRHRGHTRRIVRDQLRLGTSSAAEIRVPAEEVPEGPAGAPAPPILATLARRGSSYRLTTSAGADIWVNGERVEQIVLASGDVLELGQGGPVLRFRLYEPGSKAYKSVAEAFSDCVDCARYGATGSVSRASIVLAGTAWEMATQTAPLVRLGLFLVVLASVAVTATLWRQNISLEERLEAETERVSGLARLLQSAEQNSFTVGDFRHVQSSIDARLSATVKRIEALEARAGARERVIDTASRSVVFLQGAYGFQDPETGRPLRFIGLGPGGQPAAGPGGEPLVTFEGSGPEVEILYTGTGFVATEDGYLLTNRHVALPWKYDGQAAAIVKQGLTPVMRRFIGYLPGEHQSFPVTLVRASETADVALLRCSAATTTAPPLPLAPAVPHVGDEVIVLGYPTGIQALVVRADPEFVEAITAAGSIDFWGLAEKLAAGGHIAPLATVGIVGQVTASSVVYDAETTHGGSGGPVLGLDGGVVAVNAAIVPEFGGSNLGVPAQHALPLLASESRSPTD